MPRPLAMSAGDYVGHLSHLVELFRRGCGPLEPDQTMLSYYRSERHLDDAAVVLRGILNPEAVADPQLRRLKSGGAGSA